MSNDEPIIVFTTGGTIDKVYFDRLSNFQVGDSAVERLLQIGGVTLPFNGHVFRGDQVRKDRVQARFVAR